MPTLVNQLSYLSPKSVTRPECCAQMVAHVERLSMPAQSLLHLRAVQVGLVKDFQRSTSVAERVALAAALCKVVDMRRVLLKIPASGREPVKNGPTVNLPPMLVDVSQVAPNPVLRAELEGLSPERQ